MLKLAALFILGVSLVRAAGSRPESSNRDILWEIVANCLDDGAGKDYCKNCPAPLLSHLANCTDASKLDPAAICRKTTDIWDKNGDFVALRDRKMCGCPGDFVHGLALPRRKVTGVEDPAKPAGIWRFAWDEAVKKIGTREKDAIILAANPLARRTQDQLHIHLARLAEGARKKLLGLRPIHIKDLSDVWTAAARHAAAGGLPEDGYGVAVVYHSASGEFLVAATAGSPEMMFSSFSCSPSSPR